MIGEAILAINALDSAFVVVKEAIAKKKEVEDMAGEVGRFFTAKKKVEDRIAKHVGTKRVPGGKKGYMQEADSLAAQTARFEANRQRRMKKSGSYERPNWIPRDQDHEDRYGSSKGVKKEEVETIDELKSTTLLSYSNKAANELAFKGDGGKKAQKRATGVKRAAGQLTMKAINKEEYDNTKSPDYAKKKKALAKKHGGADKVKGHPQYESVASAVDALNSYFNKNQNLHGSVTAKKN